MKQKQTIRITESKLRKMIKEAINEIGDTHRGQYMVGRANSKVHKDIDFNVHDHDVVDQHTKNPYDSAYINGRDDEENNVSSGTKRYNYDVERMKDDDELGKKFINFIESSNGGSLMQLAVDYERGDETGTPTSAFPELLNRFEEEYGQEYSGKSRMALEKAFNQWWFYAKDDLMSDEDEMNESKIHNNMKQKQTIRITESKLRKMIKEAINEFDD